MARKALLVGINNYQRINDLKGCINDVTNVRNLLKTFFGFQNNDISVLTDSRATKKRILNRLGLMIDNSSKDDFLVFHFSGHGAYIRDLNGDEDRKTRELKDRIDELLCPWDMDWDGTYILDDTLNEILNKLPKGAQLEIIFDCCHAQDMTRGIGLPMPAELRPENETLSRFMAPPLDIECRHEGETITTKRTFSNRAAQDGVTFWAACGEHQTAADAFIKDRYNGAFTYYFCKHIREYKSNVNRETLLSLIRNSLHHNDFSQIPHLECDPPELNSLLFR